MDRPISEPELLAELYSLRAKWREFGTALKMEQSDLDASEKNAGGSVDRALQLMLTQWLKSDEERSWSQIVDALESQVVSERKLAKEIRDKHCRSYSEKYRGSEGGAQATSWARDLDSHVTPHKEYGGMTVEMKERNPEVVHAVDKAVADQLLKAHTVQITDNLNIQAMMPYLVQNGCLEYEDMNHFLKTDLRPRNNNLHFLQIVQQKGVSGVNAFMDALAHFTKDQPRDDAHADLLRILQSEVRRLNYRRKLSQTSQTSKTSFSGSDVFSSISSSRGYKPIPEGIEVDKDFPSVPPNIPEEGPKGGAGPPYSGVPHEAEPTVPEQDKGGNESSDAPSPQRDEHPTSGGGGGGGDETVTHSNQSNKPEVSKFFVCFLRCAGFAMIGLCIPLALAGIAILVVSFREFSGETECNEVGIKYSLSFFNVFFAILCFGGPTLFLLFCVYFKFEDPRTQWPQKHHITKCVVRAQTVVSLLVFILIVFELLYSLLYIIPEVINNYNEWQENRGTNETLCDDEIYLTSLSAIVSGYFVIFVLLVVLGVFVAHQYLNWVQDKKNPGVIMRVIYACLGRADDLRGQDDESHAL